MDECVGRTEALLEAIQRYRNDMLGGDRVIHHQSMRHDGEFLDSSLGAERAQRAPRVRAELDAGADLLELGRLLQHARRVTALRQRKRHRQAADTAPDDDNWACRLFQ
jgi:hypothetical protein